MIIRLLTIVAIFLLAMSLGSYLGTVFSYWFVPDIMRMYLSWGEYLERLPEQMLIGDPVGVARVVVLCNIVGALSTTVVAFYAYFRFRQRKPKHVQNSLLR